MFARRRRSGSKNFGAVSRSYIEVLESRRLLTADVWSGAGPDTLFSDAANWQGGVAPTAGQDVTFPSGVANTTVSVGAAVTVGNVEFDAGYTFSGSNITLNGDITDTGGTTVIANRLVLGVTPTINVTIAGALTLNRISDGGNAFGINKDGIGVLTLQGGGDTYTGPTADIFGLLDLNTSLTSTVNLSAAASFEGNGSVASLLGSGGQFEIVSGAAAGSLTVASGLTLASDSGNSVAFDIAGPGASSQITVTAGTISLGDATFSGTALNNYVPATVGTVITLIQNNTGNPIVGTFNNLPEGSNVTIGNETYKISYVGGASLDNVILTAQQGAASISLTSDRAAVFEGHTVKLTATVHGGASIPTGTVNFFANFVSIGTGMLDSTGKVTIDVTTLPVGADTITATYSGNGVYGSAITTNPLVVTVRSGTTPLITILTPILSTRGFSVGEQTSASDAAPAGLNGLTFHWAAVHLPKGAKPPVFDVNNSNEAQDVIARFSKDGGYILRCTVTNDAGNSSFVDGTVTVTQKATLLRIEPHKPDVKPHKSVQFVTTVLDQFGRPMRGTQAVYYRVATGSASGSINSAGLFSATTIAGDVTIDVSSDRLNDIVGAIVL